MNSVKLQSFFIILCIFLLFQAPLNLGMDIENSTEDVIISTTTDRKLATPMSCYTQTCSQSGSLDDSDSSYDYSISMGQNSVLRFEFAIAKEKTQLELSLSASPSADIKTAIKLNPSDSWPYNYISIISSSNWNRDLTIESDSSTRRLIIVIENDSSYQSSVRFQIGVEEIESSHTWMAPVISVVGAGAMIFFVICICCRIRRNRRIRRRMRAQAAYEVALRNAQAEPNENNHLMQPQAQQNQHHVVQIIQVPAPAPNNQEYPLAPPIEMMSQEQNNPNNGPLSKDNFDKRFPERAGRMFKSSFPQKTCSICLEDLGKLEKCRQLYCEHIFHSECVKLWLLNQIEKQNNGFCPNCNKKMTFITEKAKQDA